MDKVLNGSHEQMRLLLDSAAEGIYGIDLQGNCTFSNLSCIRMLGFASVHDILGRNMHELIHHSYPDGRPMPVESCHIYQAFQEAKGTHQDDEVLWRPDGSSFPVEYWSYPQIENGAIKGAVVTFIDISKRKKAQDALLLKTALLEAASETSMDGILAIDNDRHPILHNRKFFEMWSIPKNLLDTLNDTALIKYIAPQVVDPEEFVSTIQHLYSRPSEKSSEELHLVDERCFTRYSAPLVGEGGKYFGRIWYFRDISARKRAEQALKSSEARYRLLAENATDVIWTMGADMRFTYISPSVERLRGYSVEEAMRQTLEASVTQESMIRVRTELTRAFALLREGKRFPEFRGEFEQPCKNGSTVWVEITVAGLYDEAGIFGGILGVSRDVTERKKILEQLAFMAQHDALTGLANRALFADRLDRALSLAKREKRNLALLFIDLDKFKPINDHYGHAVGDLMLMEAARRMNASVRTSDTVGRIGGDEFVVLLPGQIGAQGASVVATKIHQALKEPYLIEGRNLLISSTIGIALYPEHGTDAIQLMASADYAMYEAKRSGGDSVKVFTSAE